MTCVKFLEAEMFLSTTDYSAISENNVVSEYPTKGKIYVHMSTQITRTTPNVQRDMYDRYICKENPPFNWPLVGVWGFVPQMINCILIIVSRLSLPFTPPCPAFPS